MTDKVKYKTIVRKANRIRKNVKYNYKIGESKKWSYYIAKAILLPKQDVNKIKFRKAKTPSGTHISRQITKKEYFDIAERLVEYVEKHKSLPNYIEYKEYRLQPKVYTLLLSKVLIYFHKYNKLPSEVNCNSKAFKQPVETGNEVYDYACKKFNRTFKTLDDILEYVANNFTYQFYFDDVKSNKEVTDTKAGNCTDLLQWLCNMVEPLGYEWKCVHVSCRSSGTGHVWGKFRHAKNTGGEWINRDIACCADNGSIRCIWCEDGYVQAYNPSWFLSNLRR